MPAPEFLKNCSTCRPKKTRYAISFFKIARSVKRDATLAVLPRPSRYRSGTRPSSPHSVSRTASSVLVPTSQREPSALLGSRRRSRSGLSGLGRPHSAPPTCPQRCGIAQQASQASWLFGIWDLSRHEPQAGAKLVTGWNKSVIPAFLKNCST